MTRAGGQCSGVSVAGHNNNTQAAGARPPLVQERVPHTFAAPWKVDPDVARLVEVRVDGGPPEDWRRPLYDRICWVIACGRLVARLREAGQDGSKALVIERRDGTASVVFDHGDICGPNLTLYDAPDATTATKAARAILASGSAFNW